MGIGFYIVTIAEFIFDILFDSKLKFGVFTEMTEGRDERGVGWCKGSTYGQQLQYEYCFAGSQTKFILDVVFTEI